MINFLLDPTGDVPWEEEPTATDVVHIDSPQGFTKLLRKEKHPMLVMFYAPCKFTDVVHIDSPQGFTKLLRKEKHPMLVMFYAPCKFTYMVVCVLDLCLCRLRSIAAHRDHFVRRLSVRLSVRLSGSHTFLVLCRLRSIAAHRDHFVRRPGLEISGRPFARGDRIYDRANSFKSEVARLASWLQWL